MRLGLGVGVGEGVGLGTLFLRTTISNSWLCPFIHLPLIHIPKSGLTSLTHFGFGLWEKTNMHRYFKSFAAVFNDDPC